MTRAEGQKLVIEYLERKLSSEKMEVIKKFISEVNSHDHYYEMSDDPYVYRRGFNHELDIHNLEEQIVSFGLLHFERAALVPCDLVSKVFPKTSGDYNPFPRLFFKLFTKAEREMYQNEDLGPMSVFPLN